MSLFLPLVDGFVEGDMVDGSIDKIKKKSIFNNRSKITFIIISLTIQEEILKCHFFYP